MAAPGAVRPFDRIDAAIYRFERALTGFLFMSMSLVVFVDVVHRVFSRKPGRLSVFLSGMFGMAPDAFDSSIAPILISAVFFVLAFGAVQSRARAKGGKPLPVAKAAALAAIGLVLLAAIVQGFVKIMPQGLVWSPYFGLCALLWLGLIGASMATHMGQHLTLEMGEKIWPKKALPTVRLVSSVAVALFCFAIAVLAFMSLRDHYRDWASGPGAGLIPSIDWPKWAVFTVIPYSFAMIGIRFLLRGTGLVTQRGGEQ